MGVRPGWPWGAALASGASVRMQAFLAVLCKLTTQMAVSVAISSAVSSKWKTSTSSAMNSGTCAAVTALMFCWISLRTVHAEVLAQRGRTCDKLTIGMPPGKIRETGLARRATRQIEKVSL